MQKYKGQLGPIPFQEYKIYGPQISKIDSRKRIVLFKSEKDRTTISYAKFLMSIKLGRILDKTEEVDHIDDDKTNDVIDNLQILTRKENLNKIVHIETIFFCICTWCGEEFTRRKGHEPGRYDKKSFCSKSCGAKYQFRKK